MRNHIMFLLQSCNQLLINLYYLVKPLSQQEKDEVLQGYLFGWLDHTLKLLSNYL